MLEILIVLAIIGILAAISIPMILRSRDVARLREIQAQVARDLEKAKYLSRKHSYTYTLAFNSSAGSYSFTPVAASGTVSSEAVAISGSLPTDIQFLINPVNASFKAPFGRVEAADLGTVGSHWIRLGIKNKSSPEADIDMVGVTGIVVKRAVR